MQSEFQIVKNGSYTQKLLKQQACGMFALRDNAGPRLTLTASIGFASRCSPHNRMPNIAALLLDPKAAGEEVAARARSLQSQRFD